MIDDAASPEPDDPAALAAVVASMPRPTLLTFDCDGVLAPLTTHADRSTLTPGIGDLLELVSTRPGIDVAVLSGRSLAGLAQFAFGEHIILVGSYGAERRGHAAIPLDDEEAERLARLDAMVVEAAALAGEGAWVERKPTSVVVHVREADPAKAATALDWLRAAQADHAGHACHPGDQVIELMTRPADKGTALSTLRSSRSPSSCLYVGDDLPDEAAFAVLSDADVGIKVGPGETSATHRLAGPDAVLAFLTALSSALAR